MPHEVTTVPSLPLTTINTPSGASFLPFQAIFGSTWGVRPAILKMSYYVRNKPFLPFDVCVMSRHQTTFCVGVHLTLSEWLQQGWAISMTNFNKYTLEEYFQFTYY